MAANSAAAAYQGNKIMTASKAELTLMLFEGAIKFCNIALLGMEQNDIQKVNKNIIKAEKIIIEFRSTLNFKYPVAKDFDKVYELIYDLLVQANIKKDADLLNQALTYTREMRDTWKEVMRLNRVSK